jgi:cell wall-associated NlpC family hydrolase
VIRTSRRALAAVSLCALTAAGGVAAGAGRAHADPLADAKARAAALNREVTSLTNRAETASQRYDAIEARLGVAVDASVSADRSEQTIRDAVAAARQRVDDRVQALYASGGSINIFADMLSGSTTAAGLSTALTATALTADTDAMSVDIAHAASAADAASHRALTARQTTRLQRAAARQRTKIDALLTRQRQALAHADATVRRLAAAQAKAQAAAAAAAFRAEVAQAGGTIDPSLGATSTSPNKIVAAAIAAARSRLGDPYVWGATGPDSFDCSGLTQWSYAHAGIALPRTAAEQYFSGPHPTLNQLQPGDLLFWAYDLHDPATIHHVTLYIGNGLMIAAPHTGTDVQVEPVYMDGYFGATRPWAHR